jgi:hypothetical protein
VKRLNTLALAATVLLVGAAAAYAADTSSIATPVMPGAQEGQMYSRASLHPQPEVRPDTMLSPAETPPMNAVGSLAKGPVSSILVTGQLDAKGGVGSALITPRGGAMSSPKMRADREIRQMIKRLD